jgi:hypothetical protein
VRQRARGEQGELRAIIAVVELVQGEAELRGAAASGVHAIGASLGGGRPSHGGTSTPTSGVSVRAGEIS